MSTEKNDKGLGLLIVELIAVFMVWIAMIAGVAALITIPLARSGHEMLAVLFTIPASFLVGVATERLSSYFNEQD